MGERSGTDTERQVSRRLQKHRLSNTSTVGYRSDARTEGHSRCAENGFARKESESKGDSQHAW